jgi:SAM-dependent methyltransferase
MQTQTTAPQPDLQAIKTRQQATWASGDYAEVARYIVGVAQNLVDSADVQAGWRVLDVAAGSGNASLAAARCNASVVGIDYVPSLLTRARERAAVEHAEIDFREGDAEKLPVPDASFDAVLSVFGVMFAPDQKRAADELLRACRPGGVVALANWTPDGYIGEMFGVVGKYLTPPPGLTSPLAWGTESRVRELFGGRVKSLELRPRTVTFRFLSPAHLVKTFRTHYGPTLKTFEALDEAKRAALAADLEALVRRRNRNSGDPVAVPAEYVEVIARKA